METPPSRPSSRLRTAILALGCFLAVLGARSAYVHAFGTDLPTWDQWDAEGEFLFLPFEQGRLGVADLFIPHNEHRIVPTKLLALGLLAANGQWDGRLECVANATMVAILAVCILLFGFRSLGRRWHLAWLASVLACLAAPLSWQNVIGGFHTVQTFIVWFSILGVALLVEHRALSRFWWAGLASALTAVFTLGSGLLAAFAVAFSLVALTPVRTILRRHAITLAACGAIVALGLAISVTVPHHDGLKATSVRDLVLCFWHSLQWPVVHVSLYPLLGWLPWTWLAWRVRRCGDQARTSDRIIVAVGVWVLSQYAASAYARGAGGAWPADRYHDTIGVGLLVNLLALLVLMDAPLRQSWMRWARGAIAWVGIALFGHGWLVHVDEIVFTTGPQIAAQHADREATTRAYLQTGDPAHLVEGRIPYPSVRALQAHLAHPEILAILPVSVRAPLPMPGGASPAASFAPQAVGPDQSAPLGRPVLGSYTAAGEQTEGEWISEPLRRQRHAYWLFPAITSQHAPATLSLTLAKIEGGAPVTLLGGRRSALGGTDWREAMVPAPQVPVRLVARDRSQTGWLAFGPPVEMAAGSYWTLRIAAVGLPLLAMGLLLCALAVSGILARRSPGVVWCIGEWRRLRAMPQPLAWGGAVVSGTLAVVTTAGVLTRLEPAYFEARVSGDLHKRSMELFFNQGRGIRGEDSVQVWFEENETSRELRLRMRPGQIKALRIDPMDHGATLTIANARIVDRDGEVLRELPPSAFQVKSQIASLLREGNHLTVTSEPGALDSQLSVALDPPVQTRPIRWRGWRRTLLLASVALVGSFAGAGLADRIRTICTRLFKRRCDDGASRPPAPI